jgi:hypothetical protein
MQVAFSGAQIQREPHARRFTSCRHPTMLSFVPRKVAKSLSKKEPSNSKPTLPVAPAPVASSSRVQAPSASESATSQGHANAGGQHTPVSAYKSKEKVADNGKYLSEEDYAVLLRLAVSDYGLWADADLRRTLELTEDGCTSLACSHVPFQHSNTTSPPSDLPNLETCILGRGRPESTRDATGEGPPNARARRV